MSQETVSTINMQLSRDVKNNPEFNITFPTKAQYHQFLEKCKKWKLPIKDNNSHTLTILPSKGQGTCGIYTTTEIIADYSQTQAAISFKSQQDREDFYNYMRFPKTTKKKLNIITPKIERGQNAIYFDYEKIKNGTSFIQDPVKTSASSHFFFNQPAILNVTSEKSEEQALLQSSACCSCTIL